MASSLIHICVAKKINEKLNLDEKQLYLGSIFPDISKWTDITKLKTHFSTNDNPNIPKIESFLEKYHNNLNDPFVLGYFTHLYVDKIWYDEFMSSKFEGNKIRLLDGTLVKVNVEQWSNMMYSNFSNLTTQLINFYELDLSLFYEAFRKPNDIIKEIDLDKIPVLIKEVGVLISSTSDNKFYLFDIKEISHFIDKCSDNILDILKLKR